MGGSELSGSPDDNGLGCAVVIALVGAVMIGIYYF